MIQYQWLKMDLPRNTYTFIHKERPPKGRWNLAESYVDKVEAGAGPESGWGTNGGAWAEGMSWGVYGGVSPSHRWRGYSPSP